MARSRAVIVAAWWGVLMCGCGDDAAADADAARAIDASTGDAGPPDRDASVAADAAGDASELPDGAPSDAGPRFALSIEWTPCTAAGNPAECADVEVPVDWDDPMGPTSTVFVKRRTHATSRGQLWILHGGPGGSGRIFDSSASVQLIGAIAPDLDVYTLDHRGSGGSGKLSCAVLSRPLHTIGAEQLSDCAGELMRRQPAELRATTPTGAARDLGALIDATRGAGRVFVHGASYGTYWAQRYLQLFPDQPDAVVLDGLVFPSISPNWLGYDEVHDRLGRDLLALCDRDPDCSAHLTPDAETFMTTLRDAGMPPCPDALDPAVPLPLRASQLMKLRSGQMYLFPLLYRASRCNAEDRVVIPRITAMGSISDPGSSLAAFVHIALQLGPQSSAADAEAFASTALFDPGLGRLVALAAPVWPTVDPDPVPDEVPGGDAPVLMLNGTIDPQTPIETARAIAARLAGPHRVFVELPNTLHTSVIASQTAASLRGEELPCGARIERDFLAAPDVAPDTSCIADILPQAIGGSPEDNVASLGVEDAWGASP
ncbi:MAG: alpha/beta fold hydrolase [Deltaproteobacteria bacterium]|nr:alpha/beta fold hydrolase [Deltaproteobacteria bacterium]